VYSFDKQERVLSEEFFKKNGDAMYCLSSSKNWSKTVYSYDSHGNQKYSLTERPDGTPRRSGWFKSTHTYNPDNFLIESHVLGKPEHYRVRTRDNLNRLISIEHLNKDRLPTNLMIDYVNISDPKRGGYYKVTLVYDKNGHHIQDKYFTKKGTLKETVDCSNAQCWSVY
jgi:hypothetical protein